jgi:hypothetical protein
MASSTAILLPPNVPVYKTARNEPPGLIPAGRAAREKSE